MTFCTVINCMDGRVQLPVIQYLQRYFKAEYVDSITEAGPIGVLAGKESDPRRASILKKLKISVELHHSLGLAIIAHHKCAGNPVSKEVQLKQLEKSIEVARQQHPNLQIIGLWVNSAHKVEPVY